MDDREDPDEIVIQTALLSQSVEDVRRAFNTMRRLPESVTELAFHLAFVKYHDEELLTRLSELGLRSWSPERVALATTMMWLEAGRDHVIGCFKVLHDKGWDLNQEVDGSTVLHFLIHNAHTPSDEKLVAELIRNFKSWNVDLNVANKDAQRPIDASILYQRPLIFQAFEAAGISLSPNRLLELGIEACDSNIVSLALAREADPMTPSVWSPRSGKKEVLTLKDKAVRCEQSANEELDPALLDTASWTHIQGAINAAVEARALKEQIHCVSSKVKPPVVKKQGL